MIEEAKISDDRIIRDHVNIILQGFNGNKPIAAKVDTGAEMCSIDANDVQINPKAGVVTFTFGDRRVTMAVVDHQAIQSADGGVENRCVVSFDVTLPGDETAGKKEVVLRKIKFNLNDRSDMPDKLLLGHNFIRAGDFVIMSKHPDGKVIETEEVKDKTAEVDMIIETMMNSNITLNDIFVRLKTKVVESLD